MRVEIVTSRRLKTGKWKDLKPVIRRSSSVGSALKAEVARRGLDWEDRFDHVCFEAPPADAVYKIRGRRAKTAQNWLRVLFRADNKSRPRTLGAQALEVVSYAVN